MTDALQCPMCGLTDRPAIRILERVGTATDMSVETMVGPGRSRDVRAAQAVACRLMHDAGYSSSRIGRLLHRRPSSVGAAIRRVSADRSIAALYQEISARFDEPVSTIRGMDIGPDELHATLAAIEDGTS